MFVQTDYWAHLSNLDHPYNPHLALQPEQEAMRLSILPAEALSR